jgi:thiamine transport system ATP-binding protein
MLKLEQVCYQYQQMRFNFSLNVPQGRIVSVMGPSGAGKSTLLSLIAGFISPNSGDILMDGVSVLQLAPYQRPFSMLFQEHNLFAHLTVKENIGLGLDPGLKLSKQDHQLILQAAKQVGIESLLYRRPSQLSGGQRQRAALARCFVQPSRVWLLDEPFSALDPVLRAEMLGLVQQLAGERNISVLMVTHHLSDTKHIASHFAFITENCIKASGPVDELTIQHPEPVLSEFVRAGDVI